jgi:hypothetical protein
LTRLRWAWESLAFYVALVGFVSSIALLYLDDKRMVPSRVSVGIVAVGVLILGVLVEGGWVQ